MARLGYDYKHYLNFVGGVLNFTVSVFEHSDNENERELHALLLACILFNATYKTKFVTQYVSKAALEQEKAKWCREHAYGLKKAASLLIKKCVTGEIDPINKKQIDSFLKRYCFQNSTTSAENRVLRSVNDKNPRMDWRDAYKKAGIRLYEAVSTKDGKVKYKKALDISKFPLIQRKAA